MAEQFNPLVNMANARREFGEFGGVNASVETSTTFTGVDESTKTSAEQLAEQSSFLYTICQPAVTGHTPHFQVYAYACAVMRAETLPAIFGGEVGPDSGAQLR